MQWHHDTVYRLLLYSRQDSGARALGKINLCLHYLELSEHGDVTEKKYEIASQPPLPFALCFLPTLVTRRLSTAMICVHVITRGRGGIV